MKPSKYFGKYRSKRCSEKTINAENAADLRFAATPVVTCWNQAVSTDACSLVTSNESFFILPKQKQVFFT